MANSTGRDPFDVWLEWFIHVCGWTIICCLLMMLIVGINIGAGAAAVMFCVGLGMVLYRVGV